MAYEPGPVWEGSPKSTHESYADAQVKTPVSIISSDGVEFLVADFYLKAHSKVWRDILDMETTAKEDPIQLRLEEPAAVLEILFDAMTQFERKETLFRRTGSGDESTALKQFGNDLNLFKAGHKAMDKYNLSTLMEDDLLSRMADFMPKLASKGHYRATTDVLILALRVRHRQLFLAALRYFRDIISIFSSDRLREMNWIYKRPSEWSRANVEHLGLSSYHLLIQAMYSEKALTLNPSQDPQYWDHVMDCCTDQLSFFE